MRYNELTTEQQIALLRELSVCAQQMADDLANPGCIRLNRRAISLEEGMYREIFDMRIRNFYIRHFDGESY